MLRIQTLTVGLLVLVFGIGEAVAQSTTTRSEIRPWSSNVIISGAARQSGSTQIRVTGVDAKIDIVEQVATTTLEIGLHNGASSQQTAELLVPLPEGAAIKSFTFQGEADEPKTELLTKDRARQTFDSIVAKLKDPALLEFAGYNLVRTSVFPVPAKGDQKVRIVYEALLPAEGDRVDYVLPRSGSALYSTPWNISVAIKSKRDITAVYSPSHALTTGPVNRPSVETKVAETATRSPGEFKLSYLLKNGAVTASMFAWPDADDKGGYFLMLAGTGNEKDDAKGEEEKIKREITLVIDRSGSMAGEKLEQAKQAALQVIAGLEDGESFNIISYSDEVTEMSDKPLAKTEQTTAEARQWIKAIKAQGGTNLNAALERALLSGMPPGAGGPALPIVMFLTDGLPTVGETSEAAIRDVAKNSNPNHKRVFAFGVGYDVNAPLLDKISSLSRGFATYVKPTENVEVKVSRVFRGLNGPVLPNPTLWVAKKKKDGKQKWIAAKKHKRITDLQPASLPDLYDGDQLVVLGRYMGNKPLQIQVRGTKGSARKSFNFEFDIKSASKLSNSFVPRLWASQRIAQLVDRVRDLGAQPLTEVSTKSAKDSQLKELTDEIVRLSKEFGILTEYTAFLAEEGVDLADVVGNNAQTFRNLEVRALNCRTGVGAVNQSINAIGMNSATANPDNRFWTADMKQASITTVQQCQNRAYFRKGDRWIDNQLIDEKDVQADRTIELGSREYFELVWKMVDLNRNGELALAGDVLVEVKGERILIKGRNDGPKEKE